MKLLNRRGSRRSLPGMFLAGGLAVAAMGATMGGGVTALFTDSATVGANAFTSGTVDISTSPTTALVTYSNMAPGDLTTQSITVSNDGSLAMRYALSSVATNTDTKGLKDQLDLEIREADSGGGCTAFDGTQLYSGDLDSGDGKLIGDVATGADSGDRTLAASASEELCVRVALPTSTGNAFQDATTTATFTFDAEQTANN